MEPPRNPVVPLLSSLSQAHTWFQGFKIGSALSKADATHMDEHHNWYAIPKDKFEAVRACVILGEFSGRPFTFSECAPIVSRPYLDIDCNKNPGEPQVCLQMVLEYISAMNLAIQRAIGQGKLPMPPKWVITASRRGPFRWDHHDDDDDAMGEPEPGFDVTLAFVMESVMAPGRSTYHVVWPRLWMNRVIFKEWICEWLAIPAARRHIQGELYPVEKSLDPMVLSNGRMRGFLCGKLTLDQSIVTRPFKFCGIVTTSKMPQIDGEKNPIDIWNATSLLLPIKPEEEPKPPEAPVLPPPPPADMSPSQAFLTFKGKFDPLVARELINAAYATATDDVTMTQDGFNELLESTVTPYMNHFVAFLAGSSKSAVVTKEDRSHATHLRPVMRGVKDAESLFCTGNVNVTWPPPTHMGKKKTRREYSCYEIWLKSATRLSFSKLVNKPENNQRPDELNMWTPNAISREDAAEYKDYPPLEWADGTHTGLNEFLGHILQAICGGDEELFIYAINWMAHLIQKPGKHIGTALLFIGDEGCGKDYLMSTLGAILGETLYYTTSNHRDLGRFNQSIEGKALICFNEACQISAPEMSALKSLITDPTIQVERKFQETYESECFVNVIIATNQTSKPVFSEVSAQARRWVMCACDSAKSQDREHWRRLWAYAGNGSRDSRAARQFAHMLYEMDLSGWNPREIPVTDLLTDQKLSTMNAVHQWWYECLSRGSIATGKWNVYLHEMSQKWPTEELTFEKQDLFDTYNTWIAERHRQGSVIPNLRSFSSQLNRVIGSAGVRSKRVGGNGGLSIAKLPKLDEARRLFCEHYKGMSFDQ